MPSNSNKVLAWHFVANTKRLGYEDKRLVKVGKTYSCKGEPKLCENGMHGSLRAIDALSYAPGHYICRVEISGNVQKDSDKIVGKHRKVLWMIDGEKLLQTFACKVAYDVLIAERKAGREPDPRSFAAIEATHKYLNGEISAEGLSAAWSAASSAAWSAASSAAWSAASSAAGSAASSAAGSAAGSAASSAAWSAASSAARSAAGSAARSAASSAQNKILTKMIMDEARKLKLVTTKRGKKK